MLKKYLSLVLTVLILQVIFCVQSVSASPKADKQAKLAGKVREGVAKLGVGKDALVEVKLRDKAKLAGYISEVKEDSFVISDAKTGDATTVAYTNVTQVKGHNLGTGAKVSIGIAIGFAVTALIIYLMVRH